MNRSTKQVSRVYQLSNYEGAEWITEMMMEMVLVLMMVMMERPPPTPRRRGDDDDDDFPLLRSSGAARSDPLGGSQEFQHRRGLGWSREN
jgi:hypothetical protein